MFMEDYRFKQAIDKLLYLMYNDLKNKVGLAIHIVSEETGFSTKELLYYLYKIKVFKRDIEKEIQVKRNTNYKKGISWVDLK